MFLRVEWAFLASVLLLGCDGSPSQSGTAGTAGSTSSSGGAGGGSTSSTGASGGSGGTAGTDSRGGAGAGGSVSAYGDVLSPVFVHIPASGHPVDLEVDGTGRILTAGFDPSVIDVSNTAEVHEIGIYDEMPSDTSHGRYYWVSADGKDMLVSGTKATLHRFEIQTDGSLLPAAAWPWAIEHISYGSDLEGDRAYVCNALAGVSIRDRATLLSELGVIPAPDAVDVTAVGSTAFVLDRQLGLTAWDVSEAAVPVQKSALVLDGGLVSLVVDGPRAVVAASTWVHLIDVGDPSDLKLLASIPAAGVAERADIEGDVLIFADHDTWPVYDISDPQKPLLVGQEDAFDAALSVKIDGKRAYLGDWGLLRGYDIDLSARAPEIDFARPLYAGVYEHDKPLELTLVVRNKGNEPLFVSDIVCPAVAQIGPHAAPTSFPVPPGDSVPVTLSFDVPTLQANSAYQCILLSDDPDEPSATLSIELTREGLNAGDPAPTTILPDLDGSLHDLQLDLAGKVVYVHLFSANCQQCLSVMSTVLEQIQEPFGDPPNFYAIALHSSVVGNKFPQDPTQLALITEGYGLTHEQVWCDWNIPGASYYDWEIKSFEAYAPYPRHYVVGPDGVVKYASYEADIAGVVKAINDELALLPQ